MGSLSMQRQRGAEYPARHAPRYACPTQHVTYGPAVWAHIVGAARYVGTECMCCVFCHCSNQLFACAVSGVFNVSIERRRCHAYDAKPCDVMTQHTVRAQAGAEQPLLFGHLCTHAARGMMLLFPAILRFCVVHLHPYQCDGIRR